MDRTYILTFGSLKSLYKIDCVLFGKLIIPGNTNLDLCSVTTRGEFSVTSTNFSYVYSMVLLSHSLPLCSVDQRSNFWFDGIRNGS